MKNLYLSILVTLGLFIIFFGLFGQNVSKEKEPFFVSPPEDLCQKILNTEKRLDTIYSTAINRSDKVWFDSLKRIVDDLILEANNLNHDHLDSACLSFLSLVYYYKGNVEYKIHPFDYNYLDTCMSWLNKGLEIINTSNGYDILRASELYAGKGVRFKDIQMFDSASSNFEKAIELLLMIEEPDSYSQGQLGKYYNNLASVYLERKEHDLALNLLIKGKNILSKTPDTIALNAKIYVLENLGQVYENLALYDSSYNYLSAELALIKANLPKARAFLVGAYFNLGIFKAREGDFELSNWYFDQSLKIDEVDPIDRGIALSGLGVNAFQDGKYKSSVNYLKEADSLFQHIPGLKFHNQVYLAQSYIPMGKENVALEILNTAEEFFKQEEYINPLLAEVYNIKGRAFDSLEYLTKAISMYESSINEYEKSYQGIHPSISDAYLSLARVYQKLGESDIALKYYQNALKNVFYEFENNDPKNNPRYFSVNSKVHIPAILGGKARVWEGMYQNDSTNTSSLLHALSTYRTALSFLSSIKSQTSSENLIRFYSKQFRQNQEGFQRVLLKAKNKFSSIPPSDSVINLMDNLNLEWLIKGESLKDTLFYIAQKAKSTALQAYLNTQTAQDISGIPKDIIGKEYQLKQKINRLESRIKEQNDIEGIKSIRRIIDKTIFQLDSISTHIKHNFPNYYQLKYDQPTVLASSLQKSIDDSTLFIEYFYGEKEIILYAITSKEFQVLSIPLNQSLKEDIDHLKQMLNSDGNNPWDRNKYQEYAYEIFRRILSPVLDEPGINSIIIIPDGELAYIPFELLLSQEPSYSLANNELPYLLNDFIIYYHFSTYLFLQSQKKSVSSSLNTFTYAPSYELVSDIRDSRNVLSPLAYNQTEAQNIANITSGIAKLGAEANKANFLDDLTKGRPKLFHFSGHAVVDESDPLLSYLGMYQSKDPDLDTTSDFSKDRIKLNAIHAFELLEQKLDAQVAVFSACETATGQYSHGLGLQSFASFFHYSGCPTVVASLWKAEDKSSKILMELFYEQLDLGYSTAEALNFAKRAYLNKKFDEPGIATNPQKWGNFVMIGKDQFVTFEPWWQVYVFPFLGVMTLGLLISIIYLNRGKRLTHKLKGTQLE